MYHRIYFVAVIILTVLSVGTGIYAWWKIRHAHRRRKAVFLLTALYIFLLTGGFGWLNVLRHQGHDVAVVRDWMLVSGLVVMIIGFYLWNPSNESE